MADLPTSYVEKIEPLQMFIGDTLTLQFEFWRTPTEPIDLLESGVTPIWTLSPYGQQDYPAIVKVMSVSETEHHKASVSLTLEDTINLQDTKYIQQPILRFEDVNGSPREYRRAEGEVTFRPRIRHEAYEG